MEIGELVELLGLDTGLLESGTWGLFFYLFTQLPCTAQAGKIAGHLSGVHTLSNPFFLSKYSSSREPSGMSSDPETLPSGPALSP